MDEQLSREFDIEVKRRENRRLYSNPYYGVDSGVSADEAIGFLDKQAAHDQEYKWLTALGNGAKSAARGVLGSVAMLRDMNIESLKSQGIAYNENKEAEKYAKYFEATPVAGDTPIGQLGLDAIQALGQMGGQMLLSAPATMIGGPVGAVGGMTAMGSTIAGNQYLDLRAQGVDAGIARTAAGTNAIMQAPLEYFSLGKAINKLPFKGFVRPKLQNFFKSAVTEGVTEFIQQYPDEITNIYAKNKGDLSKTAQEVYNRFGDITSNAAYAGLIGMVTGGGVNAAASAVQTAFSRNTHKLQVENVKERAEIIKKSGINPEYAAATINANVKGSVEIDGETLLAYAQKGNADEIAKSLGVNVDDIQKAADAGLTVSIPVGNYQVTVAKFSDFLSATENDTTFDESGYTPNTEKYRKELQKNIDKINANEQEFQVRLDELYNKMVNAGTDKAKAFEYVTLLRSMARTNSPDNPLAFFEAYPIEFRSGTDPEGNYNQSAYHGTPHSFEKFDLGAIGTGEGNQAHGWGLYFAADKKIADERYRKRLTNNQYVIETDEATYYFDIEKQDWVDKKTGQPVGGMGTPLGHALWQVGFREGNVQAELKALKGQRDALIEENDSSNARRLDFLMRTIKLLEKKKFNYRKDNGSLFEVDIPENDVLLDENKTLDEQPENVKNTLQKMAENQVRDMNGYYNQFADAVLIADPKEVNGRDIYRYLVNVVGNARTASIMLNENGIKGITYYGGTDGRCFVIFDDKAISIINRYNQSANEGNRGSIRWNNDGAAIIQLFKGQDASTVIHELGHYFLGYMDTAVENGTATEQQIKDFETLLKYAGITQEQWRTMDFEQRRKTHERIATGFEQYFMEGRAPSKELQSMFDRIKNWMLDIYQSIKKFIDTTPDAEPLNDEVRQVFDRALASREDIAEMERIEGYFSKLPNVIAANLSDASKRRLYNLISEAREKTINLLTAENLKNFSKKRKEEIAKYRAEILPEAEKAVSEEPLYKAEAQLLEDNPEYKNAKSIARKYFDLVSRLKDIESKPITEADETWLNTFEMFAETYGFSSGDELAKKIIAEPTFRQAVTARADEMVQVKFPDIRKEREEYEEAVREAFYNDDTGMVIAAEQQFIADAAQNILDQQRTQEEKRKIAAAYKKAASTAAKREISKMTCGNALNTRKYITAERNAAAKAAEALAKKDFANALRYKNLQAFNHAMVQESLYAKQEYEKGQRFIRRMRKAKKETFSSEEHFNQIGALLERMGIGRRDYDPKMKTQTLEQYVRSMNELYGNADIALWLMDESVMLNNPRQTMTLQQFNDVVDAFRNIQAIAKTERFCGAFGNANEWLQERQLILDALGKLKNNQPLKAGEREKLSFILDLPANLINLDTMLERWDNWSNGYFSKTWFIALKTCNDNEAAAVLAMEEKRTEALKKWLPNYKARKEAARKVVYDELGTDINGNPISVDKFQLVQMLANIGSETNSRRLCGTPLVGWENSPLWVQKDETISKDEAIAKTKENLLAFLGRHLTKADIEYAQSLIDVAEMFWDEKVALEKRNKGFSPKKVEALPVIINLANGESVVFKGGYYPLVRDTQKGSRVSGQEAIPGTDTNTLNNGSILTNGSSLKERSENAEYPVDITPDAGLKSIRDSIHDLYFREIMQDFNRVMKDPELYALLKTKVGSAEFNAFNDMLLNTAKPYGSSVMGYSDKVISAGAAWIRRRVVNATMMCKLKPLLQNFSNLFLYGNTVEGFTLADTIIALANNFTLNPKSGLYQTINSKSVFMRERMKQQDITVREVREEGKESYIGQMSTKFGSLAMWYTDSLTSYPVWWAAYKKKIDAGAAEKEARDYADRLIMRTLGSSRVSDVAAIQRVKGSAKLFTMFQGFFVTQYNQWVREFNIDRRLFTNGQYGEFGLRVASFAFAKWFAVNALTLLLGFVNPFDDDDDNGYNNLTEEMLKYPLTLLGPVGPVATLGLSEALDFKNYGYRLSAVESTIEKTGRMFDKVSDVFTGEGEVADAAEAISGVAGTIFEVPDQLQIFFWNAYDILINDMEPEMQDLLRRRPRKER